MGRAPLTAAVDIRVSVPSSQPGSSVGVYGAISNTSSRKARFTLTIESTNNCGDDATIIGQATISFQAGQNKLFAVTYPLPDDACLGTYTITITVEAGGLELATASTELTVA